MCTLPLVLVVQKQQTIRAATTKEIISTLPLAVSNNQDSRGTGELNEPVVGL